jgi:hypothetical protein
VDVQFTTAGDQEITTRVGDADSPGGRQEGGTIAVRYHPLDAAGRIESARGGYAAATQWFLIVSGVLLLPYVGQRDSTVSSVQCSPSSSLRNSRPLGMPPSSTTPVPLAKWIIRAVCPPGEDRGWTRLIAFLLVVRLE